MFTVLGMGLFALGILCLCSRRLGGPDTRISDPPCPACGWPPWSVVPCLCPEGSRGEAFRGTGPTGQPSAQAIESSEQGS